MGLLKKVIMAKWTELYITPVEGVEEVGCFGFRGRRSQSIRHGKGGGGVGKYMNKEAREKGLGGEYVGR